MRCNLVLLFLMTSSCGAVGDDIHKSYKCMAEGEHCNVAPRDGQDGADGQAGPQGISGLPGAQGVPGAPGKDGINGRDGIDGEDGIDGKDGEVGPKGDKGEDGTDGADAPAGDYNIVAIISLCPSTVSNGNNNQGVERGAEILLRLSNGELLAVFSSSGKVFLANIGPGSYMTTDGRKCKFTVDTDLTVEDEEGNVHYAL